MNFVTRALTQNLRDIRTNWAGSSGFLLRGGAIVAAMVITGFVFGWAKALVLGDATEGPRFLLWLVVSALLQGFALAACFRLMGFRESTRLFVATWLMWSAMSFLMNLPVPGWTSFLLTLAYCALLGAVVVLFRAPLQRFFARASESKEPKTL